METTSVIILESDINVASLQLQSINAIPGFTCTQLFTRFDEFTASKINADILMLDLDMPDLKGITALPIILKKNPDISIVVNSSKNEIEHILDSISLGAVGYIEKSDFFEIIGIVLKNIKQDGAYITPKIARRIFDYFQHSNVSRNTKLLTQREIQVAYLIKEGHSYKQVATKCEISVDTVRMHIRNIYRKLDVKSKIQLANRITGGHIAHMEHISKISA